MAPKKSHDLKSARAPITYMAIPRPWLIAFISLLCMPWFGVTALWLKPMNKTDMDAGDASIEAAARAGKWGKMTLVPIVISPPMELVFIDWGFMPQPMWFFPGANADMVAVILQSAGVSASDAARLKAEARSESRISGIILMPDREWVRALAPETRAHIYRILAKSKLNVDQTLAFRYRGTNTEAWLDSNLISPHTRQLIEPLIYRDRDYMLFSDIELVRAEIGGDEEIRRLGKVLFRQPTVIARLSIEDASDLDGLVEYWGRGGRRTEIRPLLESVVGGGGDRYIDIIHLLPPFARDRLYCYPKLSAGDLDRPTVVNCLWTSLNFFLPEPDDRFLDDAFALKTLKEDYFIVETGFEYGDVVAFLDEKGNIFHAAVYIADNLLFSKNGISAMAPWTLMSLADVKGYYRWCSENPRLIVHRRKNF